MTAEEYLRIERAAEWKSDYLDGKMLPWAPVTARHVLITGNVAREISKQLRKDACTAYLSALRVATDHRYFTYPDVVVACEPLQFVDEHEDTITNPTLVAEVFRTRPKPTSGVQKQSAIAPFQRSPNTCSCRRSAFMSSSILAARTGLGFSASGTIPAQRLSSLRCNFGCESPYCTRRLNSTRLTRQQLD